MTTTTIRSDLEIAHETGRLQCSAAAHEQRPDLIRRVAEYFEPRRVPLLACPAVPKEHRDPSQSSPQSPLFGNPELKQHLGGLVEWKALLGKPAVAPGVTFEQLIVTINLLQLNDCVLG